MRILDPLSEAARKECPFPLCLPLHRYANPCRSS